MSDSWITLDGNEAAARVAHKLSEVIAIYPITPASSMGELADAWSAQGRGNLWGAVPRVVEMQSEAGAAGALHGAIQVGALGTTFTASQGLLLMIPDLYKIAGELTPAVVHVAARAIATSALSIFGDHSDVMAARATGCALLASASVQEAQDLAAVAHAATLEGRIPVLHFFDGFRTSHEVAKIRAIDDTTLRALIDERRVAEHRLRGLSPERPVVRGTAMNPDVAFQAREAVEPFYRRFPDVVESLFGRFAELTGRRYELFEYEGDPAAERVIVAMGSAVETMATTVERLRARGERVGVLKVRLMRPFSKERLVAALPSTVRAIAVLDRTKEPGSAGEPLYQDVVTACVEDLTSESPRFESLPRIIGGRYGLASKDLTPEHVVSVFRELDRESPKRGFTVGIVDDVSHSSLDPLPLEAAPGSPDSGLPDSGSSDSSSETYEAVFIGLGADGTVGANKNTIKIIGESTENHAQGYFVYDSKKSGSMTVSHLRFGPSAIRAPYLIRTADFVASHQFQFLERVDVVGYAREGGTLLINSPHDADGTWSRLSRAVQEEILEKRLKVWFIDADRIAREAGLPGRTNTILQTCFFRIAGVLELEKAIAEIKRTIEKTYGRKGRELVEKNWGAVDSALAGLHELSLPRPLDGMRTIETLIPDHAPEFVRTVTAELIAGRGDALPVSAIPCDGTFPTGTARYERRNIAAEIPVWDPETCIQCAKCAFVCPHTAIRIKAYEPAALVSPPATFKSSAVRGKELGDLLYTIQVAPEDCTGCNLCVHVCPAKNKSETRRKAIYMEEQLPLRESETENYSYFLSLPEIDRRRLKLDSVRGSQFLQPLFEASGACAGCGETPYIKLVSQLFGDRLVIANATGCSSIYCGNLPTTPWTTDAAGRGPAWSNSLFEDNAEFGLGFRVAIDQHERHARELLGRLATDVDAELARSILDASQEDEAEIHEQRERVSQLLERLKGLDSEDARALEVVAEHLVKRSVWIFGGDGWAYDIGYGGLDHVLASGENVNILVLDTEVYSNTGGQMSKSTPRGAVAKFAAGGKSAAKKDLGRIAMTYENVYVASIAFGASDSQTVRAIVEAEQYPGPSLVIAYSHCIAHGIAMGSATDNQRLAVECGHWPLYRYDPRRAALGESPLKLDSKAPSKRFTEYAYREARYRMLERGDPKRARELAALAERDARERWERLNRMARSEVGGADAAVAAGTRDGV